MTSRENKGVFVRVNDGPLGEIRYKEIYRSNTTEASAIKVALERAGHQVVVQSDHRPPHSY